VSVQREGHRAKTEHNHEGLPAISAGAGYAVRPGRCLIWPPAGNERWRLAKTRWSRQFPLSYFFFSIFFLGRISPRSPKPQGKMFRLHPLMMQALSSTSPGARSPPPERFRDRRWPIAGRWKPMKSTAPTWVRSKRCRQPKLRTQPAEPSAVFAFAKITDDSDVATKKRTLPRIGPRPVPNWKGCVGRDPVDPVDLGVMMKCIGREFSSPGGTDFNRRASVVEALATMRARTRRGGGASPGMGSPLLDQFPSREQRELRTVGLGVRISPSGTAFGTGN